jgi:hypothetical protein
MRDRQPEVSGNQKLMHNIGRRENAERIEWIIDGCDLTNPPLIIPV